jgi:ubiquinone/menaquinone biosynthesis C-methylase UbiE
MSNIDPSTVSSFGDEWSRFDQSTMSDEEAEKIFNEYFAVFSWSALPAQAEGFDMGCGTGRWARWVAPRVGRLHCVDPSSALDVARRTLAGFGNVEFHATGVDDCALAEGSQDFGYSLGVLHHVPDTAAAIRGCARLLKPGAPLLLYLYYSFENRPVWFRAMWKLSDIMRGFIRRLPPLPKQFVTDAIALLVYLPLARICRAIARRGGNVERVPLSYYRDHSFYTMRTDARDRFGTPLEQRFSRRQIAAMMEQTGLRDIRFSDAAPYWCAVGVKTA